MRGQVGGTCRILRPENAATNVITQGVISPLGRDCLPDRKPMLTPSHDPTGMQVILPLFLFSVHTLTLPSPFVSFFLRHSRPLFIFLPLVGIVGWDQSEHRIPAEHVPIARNSMMHFLLPRTIYPSLSGQSHRRTRGAMYPVDSHLRS